MRARFAIAILVLVATSAAADVRLLARFEPYQPVLLPGQSIDVTAHLLNPGSDDANATLTLVFPTRSRSTARPATDGSAARRTTW